MIENVSETGRFVTDSADIAALSYATISERLETRTPDVKDTRSSRETPEGVLQVTVEKDIQPVDSVVVNPMRDFWVADNPRLNKRPETVRD